MRLQRIITEAQSEIHFQTYIFENDSTGIKIAKCLKKAAMCKVKVYVLLDTLNRRIENQKVQIGVIYFCKTLNISTT